MLTKYGSVIDAAVINPLMSARSDEESKRVVGRYERFLDGDRMDIWVKRQNRLKFLAVAEAAVAEFRSKLASGDYPK
jgi:hypothetical protein